MCLLAIAFKNKINREDFDKIWAENGDGVGYSKIVTKDGKKTCFFKKGFMDKESAWAYQEHIDLPYTIHFRKSSIGAVTPALCHPFIVSENSPLELEGYADKLLFMNGTSGLYEDFLAAYGYYPENNELMSDARAFAIIASNDNERFLYRLNACKFVISNAFSENGGNHWYLPSKEFTERDGIIYSNFKWDKKKAEKAETQKIQTLTMGITGNTGKNLLTTGSNYSTYTKNSGKNYERPWNNDETNCILKHLLNRMTINAAKKLWARIHKKNKDLHYSLEQAVKIVSQQDKTFNGKSIKRVIERLEKEKKDRETLRETFLKEETHKLNNDIALNRFIDNHLLNKNNILLLPESTGTEKSINNIGDCCHLIDKSKNINDNTDNSDKDLSDLQIKNNNYKNIVQETIDEMTAREFQLRQFDINI